MMHKNGNQQESNNIDYQQDVLDKFDSRFQEVDLFFSLIDKFESTSPIQLISVVDNIEYITKNDLKISANVEETVRDILKKLKLETPDFDLIHIFRSSSVLLLYNLIESTVFNANKFILESISNANILYSDATPKIKKLWLEHVREHNKKQHLDIAINLLDKTQTINISSELQVNVSQKLFEGNVKVNVIDKLLNSYGVQTMRNAMEKKQTERDAIDNIVDLRNALAHGNASFARLGRDKLRYNASKKEDRINDILFLKDSCFEFLQLLLTNIKEYIDNQSYRQFS